MKKPGSLIALLILLIGVSACNPHQGGNPAPPASQTPSDGPSGPVPSADTTEFCNSKRKCLSDEELVQLKILVVNQLQQQRFKTTFRKAYLVSSIYEELHGSELPEEDTEFLAKLYRFIFTTESL